MFVGDCVWFVVSLLLLVLCCLLFVVVRCGWLLFDARCRYLFVYSLRDVCGWLLQLFVVDICLVLIVVVI